MTTRRGFLGTLAGGLLAAPLAAHAQQAGSVPRIGLLSAAPFSSITARTEAFRVGWAIDVLHPLAQGRAGVT